MHTIHEKGNFYIVIVCRLVEKRKKTVYVISGGGVF